MRNQWALRRMEQIPFHKQYVGAAKPQEYGKGGACDHSQQEKKKTIRNYRKNLKLHKKTMVHVWSQQHCGEPLSNGQNGRREREMHKEENVVSCLISGSWQRESITMAHPYFFSFYFRPPSADIAWTIQWNWHRTSLNKRTEGKPMGGWAEKGQRNREWKAARTSIGLLEHDLRWGTAGFR